MVHATVDDSVAASARLITGGSYDQLFYRPTVLANVPPEARAYQQEIFGPVAPSVAFNDIGHAPNRYSRDQSQTGPEIAGQVGMTVSGAWSRYGRARPPKPPRLGRWRQVLADALDQNLGIGVRAAVADHRGGAR